MFFKRLLAVVLCIGMVIGGSAVAFAEEDPSAVQEPEGAEQDIALYSGTPDSDAVAPELTRIKAETPEVTSPGNLQVTIDLVEDGVGTKNIFLHYQYVNEEGRELQKSLFYDGNDAPLFTGTHTLTLPVDSTYAVGAYHLTGITLFDKNENARYYQIYEGEWTESGNAGMIQPVTMDADADFNVLSAENDDTIAPRIKSIKSETNEIEVPGLLKIMVDLIEDGVGTKNIFLHYQYVNQEGRELQKSLFYDGNDASLSTGTHLLSFPMTPYNLSADYHLMGITLVDKNENARYYQIYEGEWTESGNGGMLQSVEIDADADFKVISNIQVGLIGSLGNPNILQKVGDMEEGQTAVLDYRDHPVAPADIFRAIAGTNKTVVFQDENVQWVFDGMNISPEDCKDIDLAVQVYPVHGPDYGYEEETVVLLQFADNGTLPGDGTFRVNSEYLTQKFAQGLGSLYMTWLDNGKLNVESDDVTQSADEFAEMQIAHNSTFILSGTKPARETVPTPVTPPGGTVDAGDHADKPDGGSQAQGDSPAQEAAGKVKASPKTGDETNMPLWILVGAAGAAVLAATGWYRRRTHKSV